MSDRNYSASLILSSDGAGPSMTRAALTPVRVCNTTRS